MLKQCIRHVESFFYELLLREVDDGVGGAAAGGQSPCDWLAVAWRVQGQGRQWCAGLGVRNATSRLGKCGGGTVGSGGARGRSRWRCIEPGTNDATKAGGATRLGAPGAAAVQWRRRHDRWRRKTAREGRAPLGLRRSKGY